MAKNTAALIPKSISIFKGVSIYKVANSKFWYVRVWDNDRKRYTVRGTGETSSILAKKAAQDLAISMMKEKKPIEREFAFKVYCFKLLKAEKEVVAKKKRSVGSFKAMKWCIENELSGCKKSKLGTLIKKYDIGYLSKRFEGRSGRSRHRCDP